jgi:hypothetical protein
VPNPAKKVPGVKTINRRESSMSVDERAETKLRGECIRSTGGRKEEEEEGKMLSRDRRSPPRLRRAPSRVGGRDSKK